MSTFSANNSSVTLFVLAYCDIHVNMLNMKYATVKLCFIYKIEIEIKHFDIYFVNILLFKIKMIQLDTWNLIQIKYGNISKSIPNLTAEFLHCYYSGWHFRQMYFHRFIVYYFIGNTSVNCLATSALNCLLGHNYPQPKIELKHQFTL